MSVRKFLLPLTSSASGEAALHAGLLLAKMWNAHLLVLHIRADARDIAPLAGEGLSGAMIEEMMSATERESGSRARSIKELFEIATEEHAVCRHDALRGRDEPSASYVAMTGREDEIIAHRARLADLTIVPHPQAGEDVASADALHSVLFESGRPVLMAPVKRPESIGKRVAIAWNGSHESASALGSVMPFVRQAAAVTADIGVFQSIDRTVGAGLLAAAADFGADLMSMGAYSSSRLRELILGGTTRYVLENAALPVLMNR
jgi:nucleotide-binding universal stress UspA family protein